MDVPLVDFLTRLSDFVPFNRLLGIRVAEAQPGRVRLELPYRPELVGDPGRPALHGGVISTLIDTAGGFAAWTTVEMSDRCSTIDLRVDYLAPAVAETLIVDATVLRTGNRVAVVDMRCFQASAPDRIVAIGRAVYNIKRAED